MNHTPRYFGPKAGAIVPLNLYIVKPDSAGKALDAMKALEKQVQQWMQSGDKAVRLSDEASADLRLRIKDDDKIAISLHHLGLPGSGAVDLYYTLDAAESEAPALAVLESAMRFAHLLRLNVAPKEAQCASEFYRIIRDEDAELDDDLMEPWISDGPNLLCDNLVKITPSPKDTYGINIKNMTDKTLYVSGIFYFDCSELSITDHSQKWTVLPANGALAFAQNAGYRPWTFFLREGQPKDVGFIKIFVTSSPVDLSGISQAKPFADAERRVTILNEEELRDLLVDTITWRIDQYAPGTAV
ncbi:unnamed protein product [Peniophora sp. CBMAI 1063]|nr:unnamed protein product [Peniophora sp. CBMAI 1063]